MAQELNVKLIPFQFVAKVFVAMEDRYRCLSCQLNRGVQFRSWFHNLSQNGITQPHPHRPPRRDDTASIIYSFRFNGILPISSETVENAPPAIHSNQHITHQLSLSDVSQVG